MAPILSSLSSCPLLCAPQLLTVQLLLELSKYWPRLRGRGDNHWRHNLPQPKEGSPGLEELRIGTRGRNLDGKLAGRGFSFSISANASRRGHSVFRAISNQSILTLRPSLSLPDCNSFSVSCARADTTAPPSFSVPSTQPTTRRGLRAFFGILF